MDELCSKSAYDDSDLQEKILRFISDRRIDSVTGIRRMGRDNLVDFVKELCLSQGRVCSVYPDTSSDDIIIFRYWSEIDAAAKELIDDKGNIDILYGQDLCHQVPAIVRYRA